MGWSTPIVPPLYVLSSMVISTLTLPRGLEAKLYHSSVRIQTAGNIIVDGWVLSITCIVAWTTFECPCIRSKYAPTRPPYQDQAYSVSLAECTPTYPPPALI